MVTGGEEVGKLPHMNMNLSWRGKLREAIVQKGTSMKRLSQQAGLGDTYVRDILERDRTPSIENAQRLCQELGVNYESIFADGRPLKNHNEPSAVLANVYGGEIWPRDLPILGMAECGPDGWSIWNGETIGVTSRPQNLAGAPKAYAVYVVGSSMENRYYSGEIVYVHPGRPVEAGSFVIVQIRPNHEGDPPKALLKRLVRRNGSKIILEQFNPQKTIEIKTSDVISMHRVVGSGEG